MEEVGRRGIGIPNFVPSIVGLSIGMILYRMTVAGGHQTKTLCLDHPSYRRATVHSLFLFFVVCETIGEGKNREMLTSVIFKPMIMSVI
jgi:hypothetical protein